VEWEARDRRQPFAEISGSGDSAVTSSVNFGFGVDISRLESWHVCLDGSVRQPGEGSVPDKCRPTSHRCALRQQARIRIVDTFWTASTGISLVVDMFWVAHGEDHVRLVSFLKPKVLTHMRPVRPLQLGSQGILKCARTLPPIADCDNLFLVIHMSRLDKMVLAERC
jgi:hypothetical protein